MSLNRCEQRIFDYLRTHAEEEGFWKDKVRAAAARTGPGPEAAARLELELWRYYEERSAVAAPFREAVRTEGLRRTSLRNLADLLLRLWTEPAPGKTDPRGAQSGRG
jgi:hypothetical protein